MTIVAVRLLLALTSSSVKKKIIIAGDLDAATISKQEDNEEIRRMLAYVYLIEYKAVSQHFSVSSAILI